MEGSRRQEGGVGLFLASFSPTWDDLEPKEGRRDLRDLILSDPKITPKSHHDPSPNSTWSCKLFIIDFFLSS